MKLADLAKVQRMLAAAYEAERAALLKLRRREADIKDQIRSLSAAQRARTDPGMANAVHPQADLLWQRWIEQRIETLNQEQARARAAALAQQDRVRHAFGRKIATQGVLDRAVQLRDQQVRRRADEQG